MGRTEFLICAVIIFVLIFCFGPFNIFTSAAFSKKYLNSRRKMDKILKMPDGPELLAALEEVLLEKKALGVGMLSREEEEFLNYYLKAKDEEDPCERLKDERRLIAFLRNNERYFS